MSVAYICLEFTLQNFQSHSLKELVRLTLGKTYSGAHLEDVCRKKALDSELRDSTNNPSGKAMLIGMAEELERRETSERGIWNLVIGELLILPSGLFYSLKKERVSEINFIPLLIYSAYIYFILTFGQFYAMC